MAHRRLAKAKARVSLVAERAAMMRPCSADKIGTQALCDDLLLPDINGQPKARSALDAAKRAGVLSKHVYTEKASGARNDRPKLCEALDALQPGDAFMAFKLDRVGSSLMHLTKVLAEIEAKHANFATIEDRLSTKGASDKLVLHVLCDQ